MTIDFAVRGSFRDPSGRVYDRDGKIYRTVTRKGSLAFEAVLETGFLQRQVEAGRLLPFQRITEPAVLSMFPDAVHVLEHPRLDYISHPYEWSFPLLKAAALLQLDLALEAIDAGLTLSDATAYNIAFLGPKPIFIDHLSFRPYVEGEYWSAHRQFCEQYLNPLLLQAKLDLPHNAWFRGTLEGIPTEDLAKLLTIKSKLSLAMLTHVVLPARLQQKARKRARPGVRSVTASRGLPRSAYRGMLLQLRGWVASLAPRSDAATTWGNYSDENTYVTTEATAKAEFISRFVADIRPDRLIDLGCNSGVFSEQALKAGARQVIGFDFDQKALSKAYQRAVDRSLNFLPLFLDAANPSPSQGWQERERAGFHERARADAVLALAFEHHLAIGRNIPLDQVVAWILSMAPDGIIEFVPKSDPTVQIMLALREDIFDSYSRETFEAEIARHAKIVDQAQVTEGGRRLYRFKRHGTT